jgi:hypothetical protein
MVRTRKSVVQARRLVGKPATRELVPTMPGTSARWHMHDYPGPYCRWHYHPEFEIHLIQRGTGRSIVGDHIGRFTAGHLVLVGSNLPHDWISDVGDGERITNRDVVFQFHPQWIGDCQQLLPELRAVDPLLARAARGIEFTGSTAEAGAPELLAIGDSAGIDRLHHILTLLDILTAAPPEEARPLASPWTPPQEKGGTDDVIDDALNYIFTNSAREDQTGRRRSPSRHVRIQLLPLLPPISRPKLQRHHPQTAARARLPAAGEHRRTHLHNLPPNRLSEPLQLQSPVPPGIRHHPRPVPPNTPTP